MGCDGDLVMAGSILVTLLVMKNVTCDGMDDDSGDKNKDDDIATVTSAVGLIDAELSWLAPRPLLQITQPLRRSFFWDDWKWLDAFFSR